MRGRRGGRPEEVGKEKRGGEWQHRERCTPRGDRETETRGEINRKSNKGGKKKAKNDREWALSQTTERHRH